MQKISRKSLAVVALSVLLAISMALTFTFAALGASAKATGTITFQGKYSITMVGTTGGTGEEGSPWTFTGKLAADGNSITLDNGTDSQAPAVTFNNIANGANMYYGIKITSENTAITLTVTDNGTAKNSTETTVKVTLADIITGSTVDWGELAEDFTDFEITVEFKVGSAASDVVFA